MVLGFIFQSNGHNFLNGTGRGKICSVLWPTLGPRVPRGGQGSLEKEGGASWRQELSLVTRCLGLGGH